MADHEKGADKENIFAVEITPGNFTDEDAANAGNAKQLAGNNRKRGADLFQMGSHDSRRLKQIHGDKNQIDDDSFSSAKDYIPDINVLLLKPAWFHA
jgi:hypothetical protein